MLSAIGKYGWILPLFTVVGLGLAACDEGTDTTTTDATERRTGDVASAKESNDFLTNAAVSGKFEVESSKLALERSQLEDVRKFAQMMIDSHTKVNDELRTLATSVSFTIPMSLDDEHNDLIKDLRDASAEDFNAKYIDQQIDAHQDAVDLFEKQTKEAKNAQIKAFANKHLPSLREHLDRAKQIKEAL